MLPSDWRAAGMLTALVRPSMEAPTVVLRLNAAANWWDTLHKLATWQDRLFHALAILYGIVAFVALVQLGRIQLRVPEYGWTTQKIVQHIFLDVPSLAFFTTYALLVLFWAEIYYQARAVSTDGLRPTFYTINGIVCAIQNLLTCM